MTDNVKIWKAKFEREHAARLEAEKILQNRAAELVESNESMIQEYQSLEGIVSERTIACLLYTSPSPRDGLLSRMPSSA